MRRASRNGEDDGRSSTDLSDRAIGYVFPLINGRIDRGRLKKIQAGFETLFGAIVQKHSDVCPSSVAGSNEEIDACTSLYGITFSRSIFSLLSSLLVYFCSFYTFSAGTRSKRRLIAVVF